MKTRFIFYISLFLFFSCNKKPEYDNNSILEKKKPAILFDFEAAKAYFTLVEKIQQGDTISEKEWVDFFNIEGNRLYLEYFNYTKEEIETKKENIIIAYQPEEKSNLVNPKKLKEIRAHYRNRYKENHEICKDYLAQIEQIQVAFADSIVMLAKAFLPKKFALYREMPTIFYHGLTVGAYSTFHNQIFVNILSSYESTTNSKMGSTEAHELHHNFRPDLSYYIARPDSSYYATEIEEEDRGMYNALMLALNEGLADMIDLEFVKADSSKLYPKDTIQVGLMEKGRNVVTELNKHLVEEANGASQDSELYGSIYLNSDGHIPGYFMAKAIKDNGRLGEIIEQADNPFVFFLVYQEVALANKNLPVFDDVVIDYLTQLKIKYLNKPKTKWGS